MLILSKFIILNPRTGLSKAIKANEWSMTQLLAISAFYANIDWEIHKIYERQ